MVRGVVRHAAVCALFLILLCSANAAWAASKKFGDWAKLRNDRHGFLIAYPAKVFPQQANQTTDEGQVFYSSDARARLLVGAFANQHATTFRAYRRFLLKENYSDADIDYAPVHKRWFILSGTIGNETFYQRVNFTCGGRLINSWAMIYLKAENKFYDRVVEAIAPTYKPGSGSSGNCR
jgi:hypothetical protein